MKNIQTAVITIMAMSLVLLFIRHQSAMQDSRKSSAKMMKALQVERDTLKHIRDKNGQLRAEKQAIELTAREFALASKNMALDVDRLSREIGGMKNLISHLEIGLVSRDTGSTTINHNYTIHNGDTIRQGSFDWSNNYLDASGMILGDKLNFSYSYDPGLITGTISRYREPGLKNLFKPKKSKVSLTVEDINATFTNGNAYVLESRKPRFYETTGFKIAAGIVLGVGIMRIIR